MTTATIPGWTRKPHPVHHSVTVYTPAADEAVPSAVWVTAETVELIGVNGFMSRDEAASLARLLLRVACSRPGNVRAIPGSLFDPSAA